MSFWPTFLFNSFLSIFSRKITVSHLHFSVLTDLNNFYPQFLFTIFTHNIFTDLHRSSEIFTDLSCLSASFIYSHFLLGTQSPRSSQIFHRSFKDLSKSSFLHPFFTRYLDSRSFRPTLQVSTDLHRSSQIYLAIHPLFIHFCLPITLSPRSSQIFYRSSTDLSKIFQKFPFLHPLPLKPGQSVIPAHSSDHQAFRFPLFLFKTCISWLILHRSSKFLPPLPPPPLFWTVGHSGPLSKSLFSPSFLPCFLDSLSS